MPTPPRRDSRSTHRRCTRSRCPSRRQDPVAVRALRETGAGAHGAALLVRHRHVAPAARVADEARDRRTPVRRDARVERQVARLRFRAQRIAFRVRGRRAPRSSDASRARSGSIALLRWASRAATSAAATLDTSQAPRRPAPCARARRPPPSTDAHAQRLELALHLHQLGGVAHRAAVQTPVQLTNARLQRRSLELGETRRATRVRAMLLLRRCLRRTQAVELGITADRRLDGGDLGTKGCDAIVDLLQAGAAPTHGSRGGLVGHANEMLERRDGRAGVDRSRRRRRCRRAVW